MADSRRFLEVLSPEQVEQIHLLALRVLEEVGVWFPNREILERFQDAGAQVDVDTQRILIPAQLVEDSIRKFPPQFTWHARNPAHSVVMNGADTHFSFPDSTIHILDLDGRRRPGTETDGANICRVCDALPNMAVASTGVNPPEMPSGVLEAWLTKTMYTHCSKPVFGTCRNAEVSHMTLRMAEVVADSCAHLPEGQLPLAIIMNPVSPLFNTPGQLEGMLVYLRRGLPISISPEVQAGATDPATLAGTMVQQTPATARETCWHATSRIHYPTAPYVSSSRSTHLSNDHKDCSRRFATEDVRPKGTGKEHAHEPASVLS